MAAKLTGAATAPPRLAYRERWAQAAIVTVTAHHPVSTAISG